MTKKDKKEKQDKKSKEVIRIVRTVWFRKAGEYGQKLVTIPSDCPIKAGDPVEIIKIEEVRNE